MKNIFIVLIIFIFLVGASCKKQNNYITETETSEILINMRMDSITYPTGGTVYIATVGNKTVFKHSHYYTNTTPGIVDGGSTSIYAFQIDLLPSQTSFTLNDGQIKDAFGHYTFFLEPAVYNY